MTRAIVFDCFGVLVTEAWLPFKNKYFGSDPKLFEQATNISKQANRGLISHEEFVQRVAHLAGVDADYTRESFAHNVPNEELFTYLRELKKDYKLGFLSNIAEDYLNKLFSKEQLGLFDVIELSYKSGHIKPEPEAYKLVAEKLGVKTQEAVMVDDLSLNVEGAREAGMQAILYRDVDQLKAELEPLLKA